METFNEDRNCFLWVVSVVVLPVSLVARGETAFGCTAVFANTKKRLWGKVAI